MQKVFYVWKNSQNKQKVRLFLQKCVFLGHMVEILFFFVDIHQLIATGERTLPGEIDSKNSRRRFQIRRSSDKATQEFERLN